ncbi:MAG TPA: hypothetical protein PKL09_04035 [bacterium]|nr:hypothetical protein [bacterium]HNS33766.1 hypothetical protein [bacterium]HNZ73721.1 hypothetical protein [bacterium]HOH67599.1 hypothetical protein [bacterium]HQA64037.1 hypothetical protein [bacterium]
MSIGLIVLLVVVVAAVIIIMESEKTKINHNFSPFFYYQFA